eukprot:CAMPEP_0119294746 /NCGR_PEP_ID=MMETSP1329-20130426/48606_1 /TAXON_ID=114041 /ORGANISM="Genus nov. species nov., Strain RCC1024" /LENGTH=221 /DNA_ID=CAMNT_0007295645 /DNA_START=60 /DNA_END=721 /DNA_ORIENTATION=+
MLLRSLLLLAAASPVTEAASTAPAETGAWKVPTTETRELFWLHVPRTPSVFRRHLIFTACPDVPSMLRGRRPPRKRDAYVDGEVAKGPWRQPKCAYNFDVDALFDYVPLPPGNKHVVALFVREPARWAVSSFWKGAFQPEGFDRTPGLSALARLLHHQPEAFVRWPRGTGTREDRRALLRASIMELGRRPTPLLAYAEATANCTAKMLSGAHCYAPGAVDA